LLCLGGWGSFCHGDTRGLPFGVIENFQVVIIDYRGLGDSTDSADTAPTISMYADDCIAILDTLGLTQVHLLGMVGIGACVCQDIAVRRPDLARSLVNTGAWARADRLLADQLKLFVDVHRDAGWAVFQRLVCALSFEPAFYEANIDRLLGPSGPWHHLIGKIDAHQRFIDASLAYDALDALQTVKAPAMVVHAPLDVVTGPRVTLPIERALPNATGVTLDGAAHVLAGKEMRQRFSDLLLAFYDRA
jgi:pimeloyl-ACP methyl ester carboxylesterase